MTSVVDAPATAPAGDPRARRGAHPSARSAVLAVAAGALTAGATYVAVAGGLLPTLLAGALVVGLVVAVPTAEGLARRVAVNGSLLVGWVQVLWWVRWPWETNHAAIVAAAGTSGLLTWVLWRQGQRRERLRACLPRARAVDVLLPVGGLLALATLWRWATPDTPREALVAMLPGADNYAHFHMFATLHTYGATTKTLQTAPDGSTWSFDNYPQGFHALVATVAQLGGPDVSPGPGLLLAYSQSVAAVLVLGLVVVTAALVSLPVLCDHWRVALPCIVVTWAAYLWQPGQHLLNDGFANFWLAAGAVGTAVVLGLAPRRPLAIPEAAAVAGLTLAAAHAWAPLVVLAAPAMLAVLHPFGVTFTDRGLRRRLAVVLLVDTASGLGVLKAVLGLFADVEVETVVTAFGGIHGGPVLPAFSLMLVGLGATLAAPRLMQRTVAPQHAQVAARARLLVLVPLAGIGLGSLLFVAQLSTVGTSAYYFLKFFMGFELVLAAFVPALCGFLLAAAPVGRLSRPVARSTVAVVVAGLATQAFGPFPRLPMPLFDKDADGTASVGAPLSAERIADGVLAAARGTGPSEAMSREYVALGSGRAAEAFYPDGWYHGITASLTGRVQARVDLLRVKVNDSTAAETAVRAVLRSDPGVTVVVDPRRVDGLRAGLGADLGARVVPWSSVEPE